MSQPSGMKFSEDWDSVSVFGGFGTNFTVPAGSLLWQVPPQVSTIIIDGCAGGGGGGAGRGLGSQGHGGGGGAGMAVQGLVKQVTPGSYVYMIAGYGGLGGDYALAQDGFDGGPSQIMLMDTPGTPDGFIDVTVLYPGLGGKAGTTTAGGDGGACPFAAGGAGSTTVGGPGTTVHSPAYDFFISSGSAGGFNTYSGGFTEGYVHPAASAGVPPGIAQPFSANPPIFSPYAFPPDGRLAGAGGSGPFGMGMPCGRWFEVVGSGATAYVDAGGGNVLYGPGGTLMLSGGLGAGGAGGMSGQATFRSGYAGGPGFWRVWFKGS